VLLFKFKPGVNEYNGFSQSVIGHKCEYAYAFDTSADNSFQTLLEVSLALSMMFICDANNLP